MVKAKKHLGQHFLKDESIALRIVESLRSMDQVILEIGPGTGVLSQFLFERVDELFLLDVDTESVRFLLKKYPQHADRIIEGDFLRNELSFLPTNYSVIGNFPYNISSQIFFKILEQRHRVHEVVCMLQKEVAVRLCSPPGNKQYGILSVLLQAFYDLEYMFDVSPDVFDPPPKVFSGVIRMKRNANKDLDCDFSVFKTVVKQGFQNRRKTLRNALKPLSLPAEISELEILNRRAETLSYQEFIGLAKLVEHWKN
ncbi:MAG: 16S rRNA (adenine(1518)-N(6)/adenine(1519)-N(6))-dimethyltransferase RsmA [Bacteroidota bacterium]